VVPHDRIATDLKLHIPPPNRPTTEQQKLELMNRTRMWIICFNLDKSTATQFGKPSTLKED
jgi:Fungal specific transcription factor domain